LLDIRILHRHDRYGFGLGKFRAAGSSAPPLLIGEIAGKANRLTNSSAGEKRLLPGPRECPNAITPVSKGKGPRVGSPKARLSAMQ
jgi:hypothetical protein